MGYNIKWETLQGLKAQHNRVHNLLKRYYKEQTVAEEELIKCLEDLKLEFASDIESWSEYLGVK